VIPSWTVKDYLEAAVSDAIAEADIRYQQDPEIRVESRAPKHLAVVPTSVSLGFTQVVPSPAPGGTPLEPPVPSPPVEAPASRTASAASQVGLHGMFDPKKRARKVRPVQDEMSGILAATGRVSFETRTGFTVTGIPVMRALVKGFRSDVFEENSTNGPNQVRVHTDEFGPGTSALIQFADGRGVCLPVLPGFIGSVVVEDGRVTVVNYTPSRGTARYEVWEYERDAVEKLRARSRRSQWGAVIS
jgi:hypothetical protein